MQLAARSCVAWVTGAWCGRLYHSARHRSPPTRAAVRRGAKYRIGARRMEHSRDTAPSIARGTRSQAHSAQRLLVSQVSLYVGPRLAHGKHTDHACLNVGQRAKALPPMASTKKTGETASCSHSALLRIQVVIITTGAAFFSPVLPARRAASVAACGTPAAPEIESHHRGFEQFIGNVHVAYLSVS